MSAGEEHRYLHSERCHLVAVGVRDALDETVEAEPPQVIGHPSRGQGARGETEQRREVCSQVLVGKAVGQEAKDHEDAEQGLDTGITKAQGRTTPAIVEHRCTHLGKGVFSDVAVRARFLDVQETANSRGPRNGLVSRQRFVAPNQEVADGRTSHDP